MCNRNGGFIEKHAILSTCQFGFREHHSTSTVLIKLLDKITCELDSKCYSIGIFLDLSKAFDTIVHNFLLDKLQCCASVELLWITS
jgi:retron-type reverse transcriptase